MSPAAPMIDDVTPDSGVDQHPATQDEEQNPYGPNNEKLPKQLIDALKTLVQEKRGDSGYSKLMRRYEVMRDWRNRLYAKGIQHLYWAQGRGDSGGWAQVTSGGQVSINSGQSVQAPRFCEAYDIFGPYLDILTATQTQDAPDIIFRAKNPNRSEDIDAAEEADSYRQVFDRMNNVSDIDVQIFQMLALSGRVVTWTRTETDGQRFGYDANQQPKTFQRTSVYGTIESRVPILANTQSDCGYCFLVDPMDMDAARAAYPEFEDEFQPGEDGIGECPYERLARLGVLQNSGAIRGMAFSDVTSLSNCWLRPANFKNKSLKKAFTGDKDNPGQGGTVGEKLKEMFPLGVHCVFVGDVYVGSWAESMDDSLHICGGARAQGGMFQKALMDPTVISQDAFNDGKNCAREIFDVGWPSTWWSCSKTEYESLNEQISAPYMIRQGKELESGQKMQDLFYREDDPQIPPSFEQYNNDSKTLPEFQLGAPPTLWGAEQSGNDTASGYAQSNNQARGIQGLTFKVKEYIWSRIYYQAALAAAEAGTSDEMVSQDSGGTAHVLDVTKISKGNFGAYPDRDSGFPESTQAKRANFEKVATLLGDSPLGQQLLDAPDNVKVFSSLYGFDGIVIPEAEARDKQLAEIELLLQGAPILPDPNVVAQMAEEHSVQAMQGAELGQPVLPFQPPPPKSSITPDPLDFHEWEFQKCRDWLSSSEARRLALTNPAGVANVRAHAMEHWAMKQQVPWAQQDSMSLPGLAPKPPMGAPGVPAAPAAPPAVM